LKLKDLFDCSYDIEIAKITDDSRDVIPGTLFIAIKGLTSDGNDFIDQAIQKGAVAIITEQSIKKAIPVITVENSNLVYNQLLNKYYQEPLSKLKMIGVTGTDGKTTVSEIIYQLLNIDSKCGYIGTNGIRCLKYEQENDFTTPLPADLFLAFYNFAKEKCQYVTLEASSERLSSQKLAYIDYDVAIFTNLSRDHLDTHKTMENYASSKALLFKNTKEKGLCILNIDDNYAHIFKKTARSKIKTYSLNNHQADLYSSNVKVKYNNLSFDINGYLGKHHIETSISGEYNVYNLMSAIICLDYFGYCIEDIIQKIKLLKPIEARQTLVEVGQPFNVMVDYAHTANALKNLLPYAKLITKNNIIVVVGAGGSRDPQRMIDMANFCSENVYFSIFTIEDARYNDPKQLLADMVSEVTKDNYKLEIDRDKAIEEALYLAKPGDTVLILGKGTERYQKTMGKLVPRKNDIEQAQYILEKIKKESLVDNY
jgi:UDP-N-acetylmuramoyl-L-alanyl-D-glutamate--2,6-diaminopimelate ligase